MRQVVFKWPGQRAEGMTITTNRDRATTFQTIVHGGDNEGKFREFHEYACKNINRFRVYYIVKTVGLWESEYPTEHYNVSVDGHEFYGPIMIINRMNSVMSGDDLDELFDMMKEECERE